MRLRKHILPEANHPDGGDADEDDDSTAMAVNMDGSFMTHHHP